MISAAEFRERAQECTRIADMTPDGAMRKFWMRVAARWLVCAALAEPKILFDTGAGAARTMAQPRH